MLPRWENGSLCHREEGRVSPLSNYGVCTYRPTISQAGVDPTVNQNVLRVSSGLFQCPIKPFHSTITLGMVGSGV